MRRVIGLLVSVAFAAIGAGCIAPDQTGTSSPNLFGYCPQWVQGPGQYAGNVALDANNGKSTTVVAPQATAFNGRPLDVYRLRIDHIDVAGGILEARAFAQDNQTHGFNWFDYRSAGQPFQSVPSLVFRGAGNETGHEFDVMLSGLKQSDAPAPMPIQLQWIFAPDGSNAAHASVDYTVTFHYRVCGAAA